MGRGNGPQTTWSIPPFSLRSNPGRSHLAPAADSSSLFLELPPPDTLSLKSLKITRDFGNIMDIMKIIMQNKTARLIAAYIFIFIAVFGIYAKTINYKLTYLDDKDFILLCAQAYETKSFTDAFQNNVLFSLNLTGYYRPVLSLSFMLDNKIAGDSVKFAHISNILLHCFCALLLFFFLQRYIIKDKPELSFLFAMLFAFSPAASYTAAWIPG